MHLKVKCDNGFNFLRLKSKKNCRVRAQYFLSVTRAGLQCYSAHRKRFQIWKEMFSIWKCTLNGVNNTAEVTAESPRSRNPAAALEDSTPPWVAAPWWLSVSLVMSLAALTQVICMQADSACDVRRRQWCTYHFPCWLIEDCNLCWTFSLITHVSGSKTRTLSCHWAPGSSRAFSLQEDWSPPLRWAQFSSHLHYCYKCRIECIW